MKKKEISNRKNKRFPACAHVIFATAICLCMLFAACKDEPDPEVIPPDTREPTVSAGSPVNIKLPTNSATLTGNVTAPEGTTITGYEWSTVSKPNGANPVFKTGTAVSTEVTGLTLAGAYEFKLEATASNGNKNSATVAVNVATANVPPIASAVSDSNVILASDLRVTLNGTASADPDGSITSYAWECTGYTKHADVVTAYTPSQVTGMLNNADKATATVDLRKAGTYTFKLTVTDNEGATNAKEVTVVVGPYQATKNVDVATVPFTAGTELKLKLDSNNYSFVGGATDGFVAADLDGITYTLSSTNPVKNLSAYNNGNIPTSIYADSEYPTITQTFSYNGQVVGSRKVVTFMEVSRFITLHEYKPTEIDGVWYDSDFVDIYAVPSTTLNNLKKDIAEL
jgi:hypothetical protein